ncbi:trypsin-like peptidase domain-containing protein [Brevundimonas sp.]|uniref:trypsin-like peptidase domain-containing protein n=1 Tax=Brevundimonas sp. TaxID=1871086 RepID=UPI0026375264|nr:trypsin-like peptidase domain-containing protein [Brevundimonas sp.]
MTRIARTRLCLVLLMGAALPALVPVAAAAQTAGPAPYDERRGVFTFAAGLERSLPAVVQVTTLGQSEGPTSGAREPKPLSTGSGVIIDARAGIVVTNQHVVENGTKFTIDLLDGRLLDATLVGADKATDIAVLRIDAVGLTQVEVADSETLRTGDIAFAVGYPLGLDQTVTMGMVSGLNRSGLGDAVEDYIQTDAAVNSGNSGGPLLDSRGRLIGVNTSILSGGGGGNDGIAFAVPSRIMMVVVDQLLAFGEVRRGEIGAMLGSLTAERSRELGLGIVRGAVVLDVAPGSPAEAAGLRRDDVITRIHARPVANAGSVLATVGIAQPGTRLRIVWLRDGAEMAGEVEVRMARPDGLVVGLDRLVLRGATLATASGEPAGLLVESVEAGSPAAGADLRAGDVVTAIDGLPVSDMAGATGAFGAEGARTLTVRRGTEDLEISLGG